MSALRHGRIPNAYLFVGDDSGSLLSEAIKFAGLLNCGSPSDEACGKCPSCKKISKGIHPDVLVLSPEKTSIGIDKVREISRFVRFGPAVSAWKVIVMDRADTMTEEASNSFLKTLEEPLHNVLFILTTIRESMMLKTVSSRCQKINFMSVAAGEETDVLSERLMEVGKLSIPQVFALSEEISSLDEPESSLNKALYGYRARAEMASGSHRSAMMHIFRCLRALQRRANKRLAIDSMLLSMREAVTN